MANFFINRPVFAWVIAIILMLAGALSITNLPVAQYPNIAPPAVSITVTDPGASAETVQSTVVQVIEQQLNGIDNLIYFSSESDKDGSMTITLNFKQGTNPDIAQVQVQNKLQLATPLLPPEVQQQGIRVAKATVNFLLAIAFVSADGSMSSGDIGDFVVSNIQDPVSRINGVGDFQTFGGAQYAMRIWLDPAKLNNYGLTPVDIGNAINAQNVQIASGELGGLHIQCNGHGDLKYLNQLVDEVLTWPYVESAQPFISRSSTIPNRLTEMAASSDPSAFINDREFARVLLGAPTIYLVLPLLCAHLPIVRGWAEPHYLGSQGLMPAGTVIVYTPKDIEELAVCFVLFSESYHLGRKID